MFGAILVTVLVVVVVLVVFLVTRSWTRGHLSSPGSNASRYAQMSELYALRKRLEGTRAGEGEKPPEEAKGGRVRPST